MKVEDGFGGFNEIRPMHVKVIKRSNNIMSDTGGPESCWYWNLRLHKAVLPTVHRYIKARDKY